MQTNWFKSSWYDENVWQGFEWNGFNLFVKTSHTWIISGLWAVESCSSSNVDLATRTSTNGHLCNGHLSATATCLPQPLFFGPGRQSIHSPFIHLNLSSMVYPPQQQHPLKLVPSVFRQQPFKSMTKKGCLQNSSYCSNFYCKNITRLDPYHVPLVFVSINFLFYWFILICIWWNKHKCCIPASPPPPKQKKKEKNISFVPNMVIVKSFEMCQVFVAGQLA